MNKTALAALAAVIAIAMPALADPLVVGQLMPQPILTEAGFSKAYSWAATAEEGTMMQMFASSPINAKQRWNSGFLGGPQLGFLTIVSREGACAIVRNEVPHIGQWDYKACKLPNGQFSID